jgi:hypothetical protein
MIILLGSVRGHGRRNHPEAERRIAELLAAWRAARRRGLDRPHVERTDQRSQVVAWMVQMRSAIRTQGRRKGRRGPISIT